VKASHTIRPVFDDPNVVSTAGLAPALRLAESSGLYDLLEGLSVPSPNAGAKTAAVIGGMLAGADSIDDLDLLRHGGMGKLFTGVRAPSTLGTFLRSFTHGHVQQLDKINTGLLAGLTTWVPGLLAGGQADGIAFLDVDDTVREVHGYAKQGAAFGYSKVRGLNIQLATISTPTAAPVIAQARLRKGNTASAAGCGRLLAQAITTARGAGVTGRVLARADSAYYGWAFVGTAIRHKAWFSPDSCHRGVSLSVVGEGVEDRLGGWGDRVGGHVVVAGDADGDLLERAQGLDDALDAQPGGVL
jgi:hypothetical protein